MTPDKDPWADLAESLGASPGQPSDQPRAQQPTPPKTQAPKAPSRPRASAQRGGDWGSLADELGLQKSHDTASEPPRPSARESSPPRPRIDEPRPESRQAETVATGDESTGERREQRPPRSREEGGEGREGRGRRRRGRRGGRGRRDNARGESRIVTAGDERSPAARDGRDEDRGFSETDEFDGRDDSTTADMPTGEAGASTREPSAEDGTERPRRRRRGRRGGRRRGRSTRERLAEERASAEQPETERRPDEFDDEPLATAYGAPPRGRPSAGRGESDRPSTSGGEEGERRGRRRRRRRRGNGEPRSATAGEAGTETARRDRRGEESRSSSRSTRSRRRDDFTPVAGRFDEDDEGLEFLGVEEAGRSAPGRERRPPQDDDVLAETGLETVREVPSWVEAIGIVIAANLDARSRSGQRKEPR